MQQHDRMISETKWREDEATLESRIANRDIFSTDRRIDRTFITWKLTLYQQKSAIGSARGYGSSQGTQRSV